MLTRVKGTQDIIDLSLHRFFLAKIREHLAMYYFQEIITPVLEKTELFQRTVGQETDIVSKEMYFVHSAHDQEDALTLRPEMTASVMRAFLNNSIQTTPWKVFSCGPVFRHERPQKGRFREFHQLNVEIIGTESIAADAYFITMLDRFFNEKLLFDSYALNINFLGCLQDRTEYKKALKTFLDDHQSELCQQCIARKEKNILRVLDCKNESCRALYVQAPAITDYLCQACSAEWDQLKSLLHQLSVSYVHAPLLVRGLDYYNKTIFEFVDIGTLGAQSTFCGGGRYATIAQQIGSKNDYPSIGAAIGIERIVMILETIKDRIPLPQTLPLHMIVPLDKDQIPLALQIADELHHHNLCVDVAFEGSVKNMMRKADAIHARTALIIGSDEQQGGFVTVKEMKSGTESKVPQRELAAFLLKIQ